MNLSMYQLAVPPFVQGLGAMSTVLAKAEAFAGAKKFDAAVLLSARLAPDMFPLSRQVQIACDFAKSTAARLAGVEMPSWKDDEKTIADLRGRIAKTLDYVRSFKPGQLDGSEERDVTITLAGQTHHPQRPALSRALRAAQLLLSFHRGLRHSAPQRRGVRQARFHGQRAGSQRTAGRPPISVPRPGLQRIGGRRPRSPLAAEHGVGSQPWRSLPDRPCHGPHGPPHNARTSPKDMFCLGFERRRRRVGAAPRARAPRARQRLRTETI